ncbi:probable thiopurine S-methyltransferase [Ranitomeya imitator]|uniref:probable thiopurine S-methyltransferase n=1 Tax=Ranitomeya imitator TaxID=111125 RepID=UPI0037E88002
MLAFLRPVLAQRTTWSSTLDPGSGAALHRTATDLSQASTSAAAEGDVPLQESLYGAGCPVSGWLLRHDQPDPERSLETSWLLVEFIDEMQNGRGKLNIFFPLCGKAVDMKSLADMGHNVVGVDVCDIGLKEFFSEHYIPYTEEAVAKIPGAKVFKSVSGNIELYSCSIYDVSHSVIGRFDGMWDRGAFVAVNPKDRERYANDVLSLMAKDCRYLLVTVEYDIKLVRGPPFYVSDSDLQNLLGRSCTLKLLKKIDALTNKQKQWGLDFVF